MPAVVAAVLLSGDRIGLFKRSHLVTGDTGRWHCITGYLPAGVDPLEHTQLELLEETGLGDDDLALVRRGDRLVRASPCGAVWQVRPFLFRTSRNALELNWEHDEYRWVRPADMEELNIVHWLPDVLSSVGRPGVTLRGAHRA